MLARLWASCVQRPALASCNLIGKARSVPLSQALSDALEQLASRPLRSRVQQALVLLLLLPADSLVLQTLSW